MTSALFIPDNVQALFRRGQLKALVDLHSTTEGMGGDLGEEEINVIRGALDLTGKQATVAMTPLDKAISLSPLPLRLLWLEDNRFRVAGKHYSRPKSIITIKAPSSVS